MLPNGSNPPGVVSDLIHVKHLTIDKLDNHLGKKILKGTNRILDSPFLLRQGEPGTSQYIFRLSAESCQFPVKFQCPLLRDQDKSVQFTDQHIGGYAFYKWPKL